MVFLKYKSDETLPPLACLLVILFLNSLNLPQHSQVHITDLGGEKITQRLARVETAAKEGDKGGEKESNDDPQFIKDLLAVHDKYLTMVSLICGCVFEQMSLYFHAL